MSIERNFSVMVAGPKVAWGNLEMEHAVVTHLDGEANTIHFQLDGPHVALARKFHREMTESATAGLEYALKPETRNSLQAMIFTRLIRGQVGPLLTKYNPDIFLAAQDHVIRAAVSFGKILVGETVVDVFPKSEMYDGSSRNPNFIFVWNQESFDLVKAVKTYKGTLVLVQPLDITATRQILEPRLEKTLVVRGSGSGLPKHFMSLINGLANYYADIVVFAGNTSGYPDKADNGREIIYFDDRMLYYAFLNSEEDSFSFLTLPSEQAKAWALATSHGFAPCGVVMGIRGPHEAANLAWLVKKKLIRTVSLPKENHNSAKDILSGYGLTEGHDYELRSPGDLTPDNFIKPQPWQPPKDVPSLSEAIRNYGTFTPGVDLYLHLG